MKQILIVGIVITILAVLGWIISTDSSKNTNTELSLVHDITDSLESKPDAATIFNVIQSKQSKSSGLKITISTFSNFDLNSSASIELQSKNSLLSNPDKRNKEIDLFKADFTLKLQASEQKAIGLSKSKIYGPMINDLNRLSKSTAARKIALYYTDCRENTSLFSAYNKKSVTWVKEHAEEAKELFIKMANPNNLSGVTVFLIYQPVTDEDNEGFAVMSNLFKSILEEAGATVSISTNFTDNYQ